MKIFLTNITSSVRVDENQSSNRNIDAGVPQETCLQQLIFVMSYHMLSSPGKQINLFADDTMTYTTSVNFQHLAKKLLKQLGIFPPWPNEWKHLEYKKDNDNEIRQTFIEPITVNNKKISWSSKTRYFDIYLDSQLNFNSYITHI